MSSELQQQPRQRDQMYHEQHGNYNYNIAPTYPPDIPLHKPTDKVEGNARNERNLSLQHEPVINEASPQQQTKSISARSSSSCSTLPYGVGSFEIPAKFVTNDFNRYDQNPHQHLFSSSSFHTINHAALHTRTELVANSFMLDPNLLLGLNSGEFEMQM
ncbi:hypothetical protein EC973_002821 [Apophysomyces ossiformis]|uniref:Uncharacterized protein n=1 Tax=Apophysomyces ossiformis TaxID=679940 RepID=A0A8H7BHX2_9FUNG|nr:hypothetical protein EC973_002821 [Apophysomyces ossiformis]